MTWKKYKFLFSEALLEGLNNGLQRAISNLPNVVEISVGHAFQFLQLRHLIQHLMEVELWTQEIQASVAVSLPESQSRAVTATGLTTLVVLSALALFCFGNLRGPVSDHGQYMTEVYGEGL